MKISLIAWDASFRENAHTLECFANQNFDKSLIELEFLWVDYYSSTDYLRSEIAKYDSIRLITLDNPVDAPWHLGKCVNEGVKASAGEILVILDGDILADNDFISYIFENCQAHGQVTYFRRYDELEAASCDKSLKDIAYLEENTRLTNPTNYAGCFVMRKKMFEAVNGYEEHEVFSGPGMNAMEAYIRFRNAGYSIRWTDKKIFHPWHFSTGLSSVELIHRKKLSAAKENHPWLQPYSGINQSWVTRCREMNLDQVADASKVDKYLARVPDIKLDDIRTNSELMADMKEFKRQL